MLIGGFISACIRSVLSIEQKPAVNILITANCIWRILFIPRIWFVRSYNKLNMRFIAGSRKFSSISASLLYIFCKRLPSLLKPFRTYANQSKILFFFLPCFVFLLLSRFTIHSVVLCQYWLWRLCRSSSSSDSAEFPYLFFFLHSKKNNS